MARKKKHKPNHQNDLDLHGVKHKDVEITVEEHILTHSTPFKIITGHSNIMKNICKNVLDRHEYKYTDGTLFNLGCIDVHS